MDFKLKKSNLNFRVYTAASIPETGQENDICVISDVPMKNWILSPDAPSGAPRTDGDVWIRYSVAGNTFNMLKNGAMEIATISAKQYVSGAWVDKTAKNYQNGAWVDWELVVIIGSDLRKNLKVSGLGNFSVGTNYIQLATTQKDNAVSFATEIKYDLTNYSKMIVEFNNLSPVSTSSEIKPLISTNQGESGAVATKKITNVSSGTVELDISGLSGEYYLVINLYCYSSTNSVRVTRWEVV